MATVLKVMHDGELRRIQLASKPAEYADVVLAIREVWPELDHVVARYRDDEGDACVLCVASFSDFMEHATETSGKIVLRVEVDPSDASPCAPVPKDTIDLTASSALSVPRADSVDSDNPMLELEDDEDELVRAILGGLDNEVSGKDVDSAAGPSTAPAAATPETFDISTPAPSVTGRAASIPEGGKALGTLASALLNNAGSLSDASEWAAPSLGALAARGSGSSGQGSRVPSAIQTASSMPSEAMSAAIPAKGGWDRDFNFELAAAQALQGRPEESVGQAGNEASNGASSSAAAAASAPPPEANGSGEAEATRAGSSEEPSGAWWWPFGRGKGASDEEKGGRGDTDCHMGRCCKGEKEGPPGKKKEKEAWAFALKWLKQVEHACLKGELPGQSYDWLLQPDKMVWLISSMRVSGVLDSRAAGGLLAYLLPGFAAKFANNVGALDAKITEHFQALQPSFQELQRIVLQTPELQQTCGPLLAAALAGEASPAEALLRIVFRLVDLPLETQAGFLAKVFDSQGALIDEQLADLKGWGVPEHAPMLLKHVGCCCDGCGMRSLRGPRFRSTKRHNVDLCAACFGSGSYGPTQDFRIMLAHWPQAWSAKLSDAHASKMAHMTAKVAEREAQKHAAMAQKHAEHMSRAVKKQEEAMNRMYRHTACAGRPEAWAAEAPAIAAVHAGVARDMAMMHAEMAVGMALGKGLAGKGKGKGKFVDPAWVLGGFSV